MATTNEQIKVIKAYIDANGNECKEEDAVKVYVQLRDSNDNYIHGELLPLK